MPEILPFIKCLQKFFPRNFTTFLAIIEAMLCMSGSKTMLNISRWSKVSYKTIERFYDRPTPWLQMNWVLLRYFAFSPNYLLTSDETVTSKAGKQTYGLDYFFSSLLSKPIKSLCFSGLSLIHPEKKRSYPLLMSQLVFTPEEKKQAKAFKAHKKRAKGNKRGRPLGSKNQKKEKPLAPTFRLLKEQFSKVQKVLSLRVQYFVGDGAYGNQTCIKICREFGYDLISKLQYNSALCFKYTGLYQGKGRPRIYGERVNYKQIPECYLVHQEKDKQEITKVYHLPEIMNGSFDCALNVVIIQKYKAKKMGQIILFSTDLGLGHQSIIDYYSLRFQIEFNFRDAKQFWGLEDFMNVKEKRIHNAANLAFFMVTFSTLLLEKFRIYRQNSAIGIRDLIAFYRADRYYQETLKLVRNFNPNFLIPHNNEEVTSLGAIHV